MTVSQWATFVRQCLLRRTSAIEFQKLAHDQPDRDGKAIFKALLDSRRSFCAAGDPLPPLYLDTLVCSATVLISDAIVVLISKWNAAAKSSCTFDAMPSEMSSLQELSMLLMSSKFIIDEQEISKCLMLSSRWLIAIGRSISQNTAAEGSMRTTSVLEHVGSFLATISATNAGIRLLSEKTVQEQDALTAAKPENRVTQVVGQAVELAIALFPSISVQLVNRLGAVQKHISMFSNGQVETDSLQQSDMQVLQFQSSIAETRMVPSRAGTVSYLEVLLLNACTIDDLVVYNFLAGRHNNDYTSMFLDVLFSSFQLLKASQDDTQSSLKYQQTHIFICNKLVTILSTISASSFGAFSTEELITNAWPEIQSELSRLNAMSFALKFLHVCALNQLLLTDTATRLVNDSAATASMTKGLYSKEDLTAQIASNHSRTATFVEQLPEMDGSAAAVSQAIVETMHTYCHNKETHHMKDLANSILRTPAAINSLSMFIRPAYWLGPLSSLLDEWRWEEIHGESQPLYDEFGSVFLLILASQRRLNLSRSEMGIRNSDGFVARYLDREGAEQNLDELSDESQKHLGDWINALYVAEGLSDELTTTCSPQEFYLLVPTLLRQSLIAYKRGKLSQDSLKTGLEYLLEPFLLPSLVSAISWIGRNLHQDVKASELMLQVFTKVPGNTEAQDIHPTLMSMMAEEMKPQMTFLSPEQLGSPPFGVFDKCKPFAFGIRTTTIVTVLPNLQQAVANQVLAVPNPTELCPPALLRGAIQLQGPESALDCLVNVFLQFSGSNDFLVALDVVATLISMAQPALRDTLRLRFSRLGTLLKQNDTLRAEAIVHLHRRVEAYASVLIVPTLGLDQFASLQLDNIDGSANANLDGISNAVAGEGNNNNATDNNTSTNNNDLVVSQQQMDDIDQALDEAAALGNIDQSDAGMSMDDLYGLQNDSMGLGNLDDLDLDMF